MKITPEEGLQLLKENNWENPNEVPEGVKKLPEPYLAYLMKGPLPEDKRPTREERDDRPLWVQSLGWINNSCGQSYEGSDQYHYALDVRTAYAKRVWPELVRAMEYVEPPERKLQLREGGFYISRNGSIRGPMTRSDSAMYPWKDPDHHTYTDQGIFSLVVENCQKDLVREVRATELDGTELKGDKS